MKKIAFLITILLLLSSGIVFAKNNGRGLIPEEVLDILKEGNQRYLSGKTIPLQYNTLRRDETFKYGQQPLSTIIGCSDSRVPIEIIFDQGIGDVFVVRVAGNVCDTDEVASIEYGVVHLKTPLLVVLGHRNCGAVTAVVENHEVYGSIPELVDNIVPAVEKVKKDNPKITGKDLIPLAVKANVWKSIEDLFKTSKEVRELVKDEELMVVGAIYDLESGKVEWLGTHPDQTELIKDTEEN